MNSIQEPIAWVSDQNVARNAWLAGLWGFAEATFFFIVPDMFLTRLAVQNRLAHALRNSLWSLVGALGGGWIVYSLSRAGAADPLTTLLTFIPGISTPLIAEAGESLARGGWFALVEGALRGTPYKLYALHAGAQSLPLIPFLLSSLVARLGRFVLTTIAAWMIGRLLAAHYPPSRLLKLHLAFWILFYAVYFFIMGF